MTPDDMTKVLEKVSTIEGRTYTAEEAEAWNEILAGRSLDDALAATVAFYSKPFTHRAYPGDINALVEDIEMRRVEAVGDLEMNERDWTTCARPGDGLRRLYQNVRKGTMTAESYRAYRRSGKTVDEFLEAERVTSND